MLSDYFNTVGEQLDVFNRMYNPSVTATSSEDLRYRYTSPKNFILPEIKVSNTIPSDVIMMYTLGDSIGVNNRPVMVINIGDFV